MEAIISVVLTVAAALAALLFLVVGVFSLVSLWWDDLLEGDEPPTSVEATRAA